MTETKEEKRESFKRSAGFMLGLILFTLFFSALCLVTVKLGMKLCDTTEAKSAAKVDDGGMLAVIDAGHGGEDGGASRGEILEKELNLDVARRVAGLCSLLGVDTVLTRSEDKMLYDMYGDLTDYKGNKKTYDLRNRVKFAKECSADVFVSVHMNKFPDPDCRGMQIYYAEKNEESRVLAGVLKDNCSRLHGTEPREIKKAGTSVFVLKNAPCPAVLVECGFLSNTADAEWLTTDEGKLASAGIIAVSLFEYAKGKDT